MTGDLTSHATLTDTGLPTVLPVIAERTFEGAYIRTALGMAVYAIVVLKVFSNAFAKSEGVWLMLLTVHRHGN